MNIINQLKPMTGAMSADLKLQCIAVVTSSSTIIRCSSNS